MPLVWTTHHVAPARRAEFWRAAVCDAFLAMTPRLADCTDFRARLTHTAIDALSFNRVVAPAHGVLRTPLDLARAGPDYLFVNLNRTGRGRVCQHGREHVAQPGELMLIDSAAPYRIDLLDGGELLSLAVPRASLSRRAALDDRAARPLPASPAARLLRAQMLALADMDDRVDDAQGAIVSEALVALAAGALSPADPRAAASAGLPRRVRRLIALHLADPDFGPAEAAREAGVALRSVHACLAREGTTFRTLQMACRLDRARACLAGQGADVRVADVAADCGFRSAAHFSRRFRDRFGVTADSCRGG
jgi:AraC family transcriptional activator of tynA and feaB